jgi:hypothetical protein
MADPAPCARFTLDARQDGAGADLTWEFTFMRDFDAETMRVNGLLPCARVAGKGAYIFHRPRKITWGLMPAKYGDPGFDVRDWGFDWFGWVLPNGSGVRFLPRSGLHEMYQQDGRQWGGDAFQCCWTLADKGVIRAGSMFRCVLRLEPLAPADLLADARRLRLSLLSGSAILERTADGRAQWRLRMVSLAPEPRQVGLKWCVRDDVGTVLAQGRQSVPVPAMGTVERRLPARPSPTGDYHLRAEMRWSVNGPPEVVEQRDVLQAPGLRPRLSLDGAWEVCADADRTSDAPPPDAKWSGATVPSWAADPGADRCWYRRRFTVPASMAGRRLKLHFGAVNHVARVTINGRLAGEHVGGNLPFELDVTDLARPGENDLAVAVTNWKALCTKPPARFDVGQFEHPGWKIPPGTIIAPIGADFRSTGIWQSVWLEAGPAVHVEDVFVRTSVRRHAVRVTVTLRNESAARCTVRLSNAVSDSRGIALRLRPTDVTLAPGETREVDLQQPWRSAHLWFLDDPHLYRLSTDLEIGGRVVDTVRTRFGFREIWTEGPRVVLNGIPVRLFASSTWGTSTWQEAHDYLTRM